jgi:putative membrane protein
VAEHDSQKLLVVTGVVVAMVAVAPPVDGWAERSLTAHMVQHLLLVTVAAPLLGLAPPRSWHAYPSSRRVNVPRMIGAGVLSSVALWVWHAPAPFDAAVGSAPLHAAEHVSFLATATLLWASVAGRGFGVLVVFAATMPATVLGAALTLSRSPWYAHYPRLADQQVAGALMWAAGSVPGLVAAAALFAMWLSAAADGATEPTAAPFSSHSQP